MYQSSLRSNRISNGKKELSYIIGGQCAFIYHIFNLGKGNISYFVKTVNEISVDIFYL